ncbi:hypothetical protein LTR91_009386 [Friedmanniomyces endolithicus]|uniref:Glucose-methanol-choline oxidoreductase N-terminal domain-containing protein n=1 Tax=Friedmanniomyces endolithicus TaxID=329885 RepID=A0AAN6FZF1_9PEZI|nr:hypothetical protein LTR35_003792 [Friedmanniomyces endolithicus]KAK0289944.1 hypothetical protein LTS00_009081 [Friedmanniomyces endolithicus]KAK0326084.1 hypothetical protein LTR82_002829 [Friedmanniomyces endolithicus]KAK0925513.1 hypothetical protein LTR57_004814 [Friedmanniomyces endolithicus]KAK0989233.1 hypothetical protein LTR91_009386 [Friedmanniomyces endolithicus]
MSSAIALPSADFVICGGGTAGLVLANRLSEIPTINVAVIEAGVDRSHDLNVLAPSLLTALYGNPNYDWIFQTTPQPHVNDRVIGHPRGKQLGGSSAINYLAYTHASRVNLDNLEILGNANWTWDALQPYYMKSENLTIPSTEVASALNTSWLEPAIHGMNGPIHNGFPSEYSVLDKAWPRAYDTLGIGVQSDPRDGLALGGYTILTNLNLENNTRSYAATAYLNPIKARPNLKVYTDALVTKINFDNMTDTPEACSVDFSINGTAHTISAAHEVVLSAGTFGSPHILELSGIGDESLLSSHGVQCVAENANVGENLQDHVYMPLGFRVNPGIFTLDELVNETIFNAAYDQYVANGTGPLAQVALGGALLSTQQILPVKRDANQFLADINSLVRKGKAYSEVEKAQYKIILKDMKNEQEIAQHMNTASGMNPTFANDTTKLFTAPSPGNFFTILGVLEHPFSRDNVHLQSANASIYPIIDPHYLEHPADIKILAKIALHIQDSLAKAQPLSNLLQGNGTVLQPEYNLLTEDNVEDEIRRVLQSEYHPTGTCAMLPRDQGGVVDSRLRVYGVKGLRVVDASIVPLQPRANIQTFVYALAEMAADFIKEDLAETRARG